MISDLIDEYKIALKSKEVAEKIFKLTELELSIIEERLLYAMELDGLKEIVVDDETISKIRIDVSLYPNVIVPNHPLLKKFLGEDVNAVFTTTPSKLRAYINKMVDDKKEIPDFINVFPKRGLKITKKRRKKDE